jgi:BMFP domain-containing protein YqiC
MQSENRIFEDLAKVINGVAGTVAGMGREAEANFKERAREWTGGLDSISREEFDAVKKMAAGAREQVDVLTARVATLEAALKSATKTPATKSKVAVTPKTAPKKASPRTRPTSK